MIIIIKVACMPRLLHNLCFKGSGFWEKKKKDKHLGGRATSERREGRAKRKKKEKGVGGIINITYQ